MFLSATPVGLRSGAVKQLDIRKANPGDTPDIASVLAEAFGEYESLYTAKAYSATTPNSDAIRSRFAEGETWIAEVEGKIVGTVSALSKNESLYIRSMAILPAARGNRIGERLLAAVEEFALANGYRRLSLSTTPFLHRAIRLYERLGFERSDEPPRELYGTPLMTMSKNLNC